MRDGELQRRDRRPRLLERAQRLLGIEGVARAGLFAPLRELHRFAAGAQAVLHDGHLCFRRPQHHVSGRYLRRQGSLRAVVVLLGLREVGGGGVERLSLHPKQIRLPARIK